MKTDPNCSNIESLIYLTDDELDNNEKQILTTHLETCLSCRATRDRFLAVRRATIAANAISQYPDIQVEITLPAKRTRNVPLRILTALSGAAAILLIGLFIWEQTISVYKISRLENSMTVAQPASMEGMIDRLTVRAAFRDKEWNEFWDLHESDQAAINQSDLSMVRSMVETRIRGNRKPGIGSGSFYGKFLLANKYAYTYQNLIK